VAVDRAGRRGRGMSHSDPPSTLLPHHKLIAYQVALELVKLVGSIRIRDAQLRQQARKAQRVRR